MRSNIEKAQELIQLQRTMIITAMNDDALTAEFWERIDILASQVNEYLQLGKEQKETWYRLSA